MSLFNENPSAIITPLLRYGLIALSGGLISKGYITAEQVEIVVGAIVSVGTVAWLAVVKYKQGDN